MGGGQLLKHAVHCSGLPLEPCTLQRPTPEGTLAERRRSATPTLCILMTKIMLMMTLMTKIMPMMMLMMMVMTKIMMMMPTTNLIPSNSEDTVPTTNLM